MSVHFDYLLRLADTSLILGQRLSEWCGHGPVLEEDLALTNVALDCIGQARLLLSHAADVEGQGRDEDQLAFLRDDGRYRNLTIVELPNGDFGATVVRNLLVNAWQAQVWASLADSTDRALAAIAEKSAKETRYHVTHAADWTIRLGDGTDESHGRMQSALDRLWPYTAEFFVVDALDEAVAAAGIAPLCRTLEAAWMATVVPVFEEATLTVPGRSPFRSRGKTGVHTEHLGHLLAGMQHLQRAYPGGQW